MSPRTTREARPGTGKLYPNPYTIHGCFCYNGGVEQFQIRLYIPQGPKYLLSKEKRKKKKEVPTSGLDNEAQEPSQLRQKRSSNHHCRLSTGCFSHCPNGFSSVPVSSQYDQQTDPKSEADVCNQWHPGQCPRISCKGSWKPEHQTDLSSTTTQSQQGPNQKGISDSRTHRMEVLCVVRTKPSTTAQLGSFYFLWFNPNTGFSANLTNKRC